MTTTPVSNLITERILAWLLSRRDRHAPIDPVTGRYLMPYGPIFRRFVAFFLLASAGFLILGFVGTMDDPKAMVITTAIFGALFASMLWAFYESHFVTIGFSAEGLFRRGFGQEVWVPWSEVTTIRFSESMKWFSFQTRGRGTIRVSLYRNGLATLTDLVGRAPLEASADDAARLLKVKASSPI